MEDLSFLFWVWVFKIVMEPLQSASRLKLANLEPVDEISDSCGFFVPNCSLVDFDVYCSIGLSEVGLEYGISHLLLVLGR